MAHPEHRQRAWASATAIYLLLALYQLYPAWTSPAHGVVGSWAHPDMISNHWLYRWVAEQLTSGGSILHNDRYYFPIGDAPWLAGNGSDAVPATLIAALLAWPFSVTVWTLLTITLNGLGGYALARVVGAGHRGALVGGAALVLCPYLVYEISCARLAQAPIYWSAFFLASWIHLLRQPSWRRGLGAALLFGGAAFTYWYYGLWMAMTGAALWLLIPTGRGRALRFFLPWALLFTLPPLLVFLGAWSQIPGVADGVFPSPLAMATSLPPTFPLWLGHSELSSLALPVTVWALALAGLGRGPDRSLRLGLIGVAGFFYLLCLGPDLVWPDGSSTGIPGPFRLVYGSLAPLRRFWWPYRHLAPMTLALVPLMALGAERLVARWGSQGSWAFAGLLLAMPIEEWARDGSVEVTISYWRPPAAYEALGALPEGHLLELPLSAALTRSQPSLSYQWLHHRTLVNGHAMWVKRVRPAAWDEWLAHQPLLDALRRFEDGTLSGPFTLPDGAVASLRAQGLRYLSVNPEFYPGELSPLGAFEADLLHELFGEPVIEDANLAVWDLEGWTGSASLSLPRWWPPADQIQPDGRTTLPATARSAGWQLWERSLPPLAPRRSDLPSRPPDRR